MFKLTANKFDDQLVEYLPTKDELQTHSQAWGQIESTLDWSHTLVVKGCHKNPDSVRLTPLLDSPTHGNLFGNQVAQDQFPRINEDVLRSACVLPFLTFDNLGQWALLAKTKKHPFLTVPVGMMDQKDKHIEATACTALREDTGLVANGKRALSQLTTWTSKHVYAGLEFKGETQGFICSEYASNDVWKQLYQAVHDADEKSKVITLPITNSKTEKLILVDTKLFLSGQLPKELASLSGMYLNLFAEAVRRTNPFPHLTSFA
jgi:hypothetical protein